MVMKKALIVSTNAGFIASFEQSDAKILRELGYEVHCAANMELYGSKDKLNKLKQKVSECHHIPFSRSPLSKDNIKAYQTLKQLITQGQFQLIHCHTPVAAALTRIVTKRHTGIKVIYTAHGFHFYKGAPIRNWILFYPIEKRLSKATDVLITINKEDYNRANRRFKAKKIVYVPGVGIDTKKFKENKEEGNKKRAELGIRDDETMILSVGELNTGKNHEVVIRALGELKKQESDISKIRYIICGTGEKQQYLTNLAEEQQVKLTLLGFREDIPAICQAADLFVFASLREGLPVALMEAIATNIPVLCSNIRGNVDLVSDRLFRPNDYHELAALFKDVDIWDRAKIKENMSESMKQCEKKIGMFDKEIVNRIMTELYTGLK